MEDYVFSDEALRILLEVAEVYNGFKFKGLTGVVAAETYVEENLRAGMNGFKRDLFVLIKDYFARHNNCANTRINNFGQSHVNAILSDWYSFVRKKRLGSYVQ